MKNLFYFLLIILFGFLAIKALLHQGFYTSHDGRHQIVRLVHFHQGLVDGQLPVRWAGTALNGYGYPLFIFTYRLPFWIAETCYLFNKNLVNAIKFTFIITYLLSGLSMYWFAKELWHSKPAAFICSVFYLWAPYRFVDIFVRAALGEAVTFVFIPTFFLGILFLSRNKIFSGFVLTCSSLAALILSHALTLILWVIPIILWLVINLIQTKFKKIYIFETLLSFIWSLALTAYYWIPATFEKQYTQFSASLGDYYKDHFVTLKQLIYSRWGYGFSMAGVEDDAMSFQVGVAQWLIIGLIAIYLIVRLLMRNKLKLRIFAKITKQNISNIVFFIIIFLVSIYFMLSSSEWFYHRLKNMMVIDLPWRFLGVSIFAASLLSGSLILILESKITKCLLGIFIITLCLYGNRNHLNVNQYTYYSEKEYWQDQETTNEHNDYMPRGFIENKEDDVNYQLKTLTGNSDNKIILRNSFLVRFYSEVKSNTAEILTRVANFPGWQMYIDGEITKITDKDGRIKVALTRGNHLITLIFKETKVRLFSDWLSLISFIIFSSYCLWYAKKIRS